MIPVIAVAFGTTSKSFRKYPSNIPGKDLSKHYRKQPYWALHTHTHTHIHTSESTNIKPHNIQHAKEHHLLCSL